VDRPRKVLVDIRLKRIWMDVMLPSAAFIFDKHSWNDINAKLFDILDVDLYIRVQQQLEKELNE
jgi:hypothetical protein